MRRRLFLILLTAVILLSTMSVCADASCDDAAPVVKSISIDKHNVTVGDTVTVTATITDASGVKSNPYIGFYDRNSASHTMYLRAQGNNVYKGTLTITSDYVNGTYRAEWLNLEDIYGNGGTDYSSETKYSDVYFTVSGATSDNTAPVIKSICIDKHNVTVGDTVTVTATITDDSGVKSNPYIGFYDRNSASHTMYLKAQGNNVFKGTLTITSDYVYGTYRAEWLSLEDIFGNGGTDYSSETKYPDIYFVIDETHSWNDGTETTVATCTTDGVMLYTCKVCGATKTEAVPALGHAWNSGEVTTTATCMTDGVKTYTCSRCGATMTETIVKLSHSYIASVTAPTCTEGGYTTYTCSLCGDSYVSDYTDALGHAWNSGEVSTPVTCTTDGIKTYTCTLCGATKTESITKLGHSYVAVVTAPTCTAGYTTYTCSLCGDSYISDYTEALGHNYTDSVTTPTCTDSGYTIYTCSLCGDSYVSDYTDALGHAWNSGEVTTPAACTTDGVRTYTCTRCDNTYTSSIPATGHDIVTDEAVAATCTETGLSEGSHCSICGETLVAQTTVPALNHSYDDGTITVPATDTDDGIRTYTCMRCGVSYTSVIPALGHSYDNGTVTVSATCTDDGIRTYTCADCGDTYTEIIPAYGHTAATDRGVAATCTETGLTEGSHCTVCGETLVAQEIIPVLGHTYDTGSINTPASCTEDGVCTYICAVCGDTYSEIIPSTGHTPVTDPAVAATVSTTGLTEGSHCAVCGETLIAQQIIPVLSANPTPTPVPTTEPTPVSTPTTEPMDPTPTADPSKSTPAPTAEPTETPAAVKGDFSGDGLVNVADALRLFRAVNGQIDSLPAALADLNGDGLVNIIDALKLFRFVNEQLNTL